MTSEMAEEGAQQPVLNVVSTVRSATSSPLKWQIQNFGLFLTSKAKALQQQFGPMHNVQFELTLSKRQSPRNENDRLELAVRPCLSNDQFATAQLKGRIWLNSDAEWTSNFVLNFTDATQHYFATPFGSFNSESSLTVGDMIYEQIVVDTDVLSRWVMRLDDSFIMSRSAIEQSQSEELREWDNVEHEEESMPSTMQNPDSVLSEVSVQSDGPTDYEKCFHFDDVSVDLDTLLETPKTSSSQADNNEVSSTAAVTGENLEILSAVGEFNDPLTETPVQVASPETNSTPLTLQSLRQIDEQVDTLLERLKTQSPLTISYQKKYRNLDDDWLKSLDEILMQKIPVYDLETLKIVGLDLKQAHRDLYQKLRKQFLLFGADFLLFEFPSADEKQNLDELYILIDYFEAVVQKLSKYQDILGEMDDEFWPFDDFPNCLQETKWLDDYKKVRGTNEDELFIAQEIRSHATQAEKLERIQQELNQLWAGYARFSKDTTNNKTKWFKEAEFLIERMHGDIAESESKSLELFVRPMSVEEFGEMRCKLAQLESNVAAALGKMDEEDSIVPYFIGLDLNDLEEKVKYLRQSLTLPTTAKTAPLPAKQLEKIKEKIKDLDTRVTKPSHRLQLDAMKNMYDDLSSRISQLKDQNSAPCVRFNKSIEAINQLHSNFSYTMATADSDTLVNYEVELCKCLAELERVVADIQQENLTGAPFWRQHYDESKYKTDWVAQCLRDRLEPWRQFMDLYTSIEQSHKTVGELVSQIGNKPDGGYNETCQDIELLKSVNKSFEATRKDFSYIRQLCSAGQMKSTGLASEATRRLQRIDQAHRLVENSLRALMFRLKAKTVNPFYGRGRRGHRHNNAGGSSYDPFY